MSSSGAEVVPAYLRTSDLPWLRALVDEYRRFAGRPRRELLARLREPLPVASPVRKLLQARHVLDAMSRTRVASPVPPRRIRAAVFGQAACGGGPRDAAIARAQAALGLGAGDAERYLFADVGDERVVGPLPEELDHGELALQVNLALVQGLLGRATAAQARLRGNARDVVRYARLRGLLCGVSGSPDEESFVLDVSGPLAVFRRTTVYGRALASLVPRLSWCDAWELVADCAIAPGERKRVVVRAGDPLPSAPAPRRFDSKLEERFARDLARAAADWDVVREPRPVAHGRTLVFPDFELVHRRQRDRRWLVEIVGFWTHDYVSRKLAQLRAVAGDRWIVCIDEDRACEAGDLPRAARVVPFRRRIDVARVVRLIE